MIRRRTLAVACAASIALALLAVLRLDAGASTPLNVVSVDTSYATNGRFTLDIGGPNREDNAFSSALQPDGKVVVSGKGFNRNTGNFDFTILRYLPNGGLDPTFGWGGVVLTDFYQGHDEALAIALQPDGKLVVAGLAGKPGAEPPEQCQFNCLTVPTDFAIARYNANGSLDTSFGLGGRVTTDFYGGQDVALSVILQPDGKILAGGTAYRTATDADFAIARYNSNGSRDTTFGWNGLVTTTFGGGEDAIYRLNLQADGNIVAAGASSNATTRKFDFALARYRPNGSLDPSYGWGGVVLTDFYGGSDVIHASLLQPDGKLVAGGLAFNPNTGNYDYALARYNTNGSLDATFGPATLPGRVTTDFDGSYDQVMDLLLQPDGKIIAPGEEVNPITQFNFAITRYNTDGTLDPTFGPNGRVSLDWFGGLDGIHAAVLQPDGKVVVSGDIESPATQSKDFAAMRYLVADPSYISAVVSSLNASAFAAPDQRTTIMTTLAGAEVSVLDGQAAPAVAALQALRTHLDGCGTAPDANDWIVDCGAQMRVRGLIDQVIAKLSSQ